jgi:plasmid maintenance system antidote protein VapI
MLKTSARDFWLNFQCAYSMAVTANGLGGTPTLLSLLEKANLNNCD